MNKKKIALIGNPNVGKSTVYNALTGMHQHTGNWPGKTVEQAIGCFKTSQNEYELIDLPGTYSLFSTSIEERITRDFIMDAEYDLIIVVMDATALSRTLLLGLQVARKSRHVIFVVNLMDEASRLGIKVNPGVLAKNCGIPVIGINATSKQDIKALKMFIDEHIDRENELFLVDDLIEFQYRKAQEICQLCVTRNKPRMRSKLDEWLVHPVIGSLLMLGMLGVICFLTISGANIPSRILGELFANLGVYFREWLVYLRMSPWWIGLWMDGVYLILSFVVSVMFPPMVIFFTLFSFLEEYGLLPRIAFCLDGCFEKCHGHGKQALCMCMGLGCNCVGVSGCRIMESKRDRDIGMITNSFMPCNGRFPMIITIASIFFGIHGIDSIFTSSLVLTACICISVASVFLVTYALSIFVYKGKRGSFILELPPYRVPHIKTILTHSLFHKTFTILGRAVLVSSVAGACIYIISPYLHYITVFLNPIGYFIGVDGAVLLSLLLGAPANEIVMPILLMIYKGTNTIVSLDIETTKEILLLHGWDIHRAICFIVLVLFHFPCTTTLLTIYKETKNKKTLLLSIIVPALYGIGLCILITMMG